MHPDPLRSAKQSVKPCGVLPGASSPPIANAFTPKPVQRRGMRSASANLAVALLLCCGSVSAAHAASFDCLKAISPMEKAICSNPALSAADTGMAAAYRRALALLPEDAATTFRADQRRWLETLQRGCGIAEAAEPGTDGKPIDVPPDSPAAKANLKRMADCMAEPYRDRTDVLKHAYAKIGDTVFLTRSLTLLSPDTEPASDTVSHEETFPGFGSLSIQWPEAQTTDPRWLAWNAALLQKLQSGFTEKGKTKPGWHDSMAADTDSTLAALTPTITNNRVTVAIENNNMGHGAAHPNEAFLHFTWLLDAQRPLQPEDVFKPGSPWKTTLATYAWNQLIHGDQHEGLYDTAHGARNKALLDDLSDVGNWTLTPRGLSLAWPEYTLAPRLYQLDDTLVPWAKLRPLLVPGFVP